MSIPSAVNTVNLVNTVNAVKKRPPSVGVALASDEFTFALIPSNDFGEIIDSNVRRRRTRSVWTGLTSLAFEVDKE